MADTSDLVAQFIAFTGVEDAGKAMQMLEATNHDIQAAVELYFAAHADAPSPTQPTKTRTSSTRGTSRKPWTRRRPKSVRRSRQK
jgi:hypothetical protein